MRRNSIRAALLGLTLLLAACSNDDGASDGLDGPPLGPGDAGAVEVGPAPDLSDLIDFDGGVDNEGGLDCAEDCLALNDQCTIAFCDRTSGECALVPVEDGSLCDDADGCTDFDGCRAGECAGLPITCTAEGPCVTSSCNPDTGACEITEEADGTACDDGSLCSTGDSCVGGVCQGTMLDCAGAAASDDCAVGTCDHEVGCVSVPRSGALCDDGDGCTRGDTCSEAGICEGTALDCAASAGLCAAGSCDPVLGTCVITPFADGAACDDGDACTEGTCSAGVCRATAVACPSGDACNTASCDPATGCFTTPRTDAACDDADPCTAGDTCSASGVCAGTTLDCAVLDSDCTFGVCDGVRSICAAMPVNDGTSCDQDLDDCVVEGCSDGTCAISTTLAECSSCGSGTDRCHGAMCEPELPTLAFDFEKASVPAAFGATSWVPTSSDSFDGLRSLRSGTLAAGQAAGPADTLSLEVVVANYGTFEFMSKTLLDSDASMVFSIDGMEEERWEGNTPWAREQGYLFPGRHVLSWRIEAGAAGTTAAQGGFLDALTIWGVVPDVIDLDVDLGPLTTSGSAPFAVDSVGAYEGAGSAFATPGPAQTSTLRYQVDVTRESFVSFALFNDALSGEALDIFVNGVKDTYLLPDATWHNRQVIVPAGNHAVELRFTAGAGAGSRRIGVDDVSVSRARCP